MVPSLLCAWLAFLAAFEIANCANVTRSYAYETLGTLENPAESCLHLLKNREASAGGRRFLRDGVFHIRPRGVNGAPFHVFCDMHTAGGGWTLVAVVANGDDEHWIYDDRDGNDGQRASHWESRTTIGELTYRTPFANEDYKSKAYYTMAADEILLTYKGGNLARTATNCLGDRSLRSAFNRYRFSCAGSKYSCYFGASRCTAPGRKRLSSNECTHVCSVAEQYGTDAGSDGQRLAEAGETQLYLKTGEANGAQDGNKDRAYFSFANARQNVDYPNGLGSFSRINGKVISHDIGIHNDASVRATDEYRFYGIFVR